METRKTTAYERLKNKSKKKVNLFDAINAKEETYWVGAAAGAVIFAGFIDGGVSVAIAYGARKLYEYQNGKIS